MALLTAINIIEAYVAEFADPAPGRRTTANASSNPIIDPKRPALNPGPGGTAELRRESGVCRWFGSQILVSLSRYSLARVVTRSLKSLDVVGRRWTSLEVTINAAVSIKY